MAENGMVDDSSLNRILWWAHSAFACVPRGVAMQKTAALAAIERNRHWLVPVPDSFGDATLAAGVVGGVPGGVASQPDVTITYLSRSEPLADRKLVRASSIDLLVKRPAESAEKIRSLTEHVGGFLVKSQTNGAQDATNASLAIRVPVGRFAEVVAEIRKLGLRVESEQMEAQDVTKQYVDQQAHLRNLRALEAQYLTILQQAKTVKDTLNVSEKLNAVHAVKFKVCAALLAIAVGTAIAGCPPHRSGRALVSASGSYLG
jgi:Domain of unknown function (DUF4349)